MEFAFSGNGQKRADRVIGVIGKPVAVGHQDQKKIQQQLMGIQSGDKALGDQPVGDETEAAFNAPDTLRVEDFLCDHGRFSWWSKSRPSYHVIF